MSVLLHLGPGAVASLAYLNLLPLVRSWEMPSVAALSLSVLVGVAPTQLTILALHARRHRGTGETTIDLRERLSVPALAIWTAVVVLAAAAAFATTMPLSTWVEASAFAWSPQQWKIDLGTNGAHSHSALIWTSVLILAATVVIAPVVEELYFRGFLLPRTPEQLGHGTPLAHAALFAGYHLWTPGSARHDSWRSGGSSTSPNTHAESAPASPPTSSSTPSTSWFSSSQSPQFREAELTHPAPT